MLTRLSKILIACLVVLLLLVAIGFYTQVYLMQQGEIKLLEVNRPVVVSMPTASPSATEAPTATPAASVKVLVKPTVAVAEPTS